MKILPVSTSIYTNRTEQNSTSKNAISFGQFKGVRTVLKETCGEHMWSAIQEFSDGRRIISGYPDWSNKVPAVEILEYKGKVSAVIYNSLSGLRKKVIGYYPNGSERLIKTYGKNGNLKRRVEINPDRTIAKSKKYSPHTFEEEVEYAYV